MKKPTPPMIGREQHVAGLHRAEIGRVGDLEIDRRQPAGDAGEKAGKAEGDDSAPPADCSRRTARARDCRAPRCTCGRSGVRVSAYIAITHDAGPGRDQIVDLDLRAEVPVEQPQQLGAVGRRCPPRRRRSVRRISADWSRPVRPMPSEIIANAVPLRWVETQPKKIAKSSPARPPTSGISGSGIGSLLAPMTFMAWTPGSRRGRNRPHGRTTACRSGRAACCRTARR